MLNWKQPDYTEIYEARRDRLLRIRSSKELIGPLFEYYRENPVAFINDWGVTADPRNLQLGLPVVVPFVLFPRQAEFIDWLYERWKKGESGLVYKSRDMGVSWLCCAFSVWLWIFWEQSAVGIGSRKAEYVDNGSDPKSLFWKVRKFVEGLPEEFRPSYSSIRMQVNNEVNGSSIVGEAGENIGRGARTSFYVVDEAAYLEDQEAVEAALSATTRCRVDVSTPASVGGLFERKVAAGVLPVFRFEWRDDPRKDETWYADQVKRFDPVIVAREIDLNPMMAVQNVLLDGSKVAAAMSRYVAPPEGVGPWMVGVDAAHMGNDCSVIHGRRGRLNMPQRVIRGSTDGGQLSGAVVAYCDDLVKAGGEIGQIVVELDGPGSSCFDFLKLSKYRDKVRGVHTGARQKDGRNYNLRAKLWNLAKAYFDEGGVYLPESAELKQQLCSMLYQFKDGMYLMMSKKDYKKEFHRSPDNADAFVLTFLPYEPKYERAHDPFSVSYSGNAIGNSWMSW